MLIRDSVSVLSLCLTAITSTSLFAEGESWLHEIDLGLNGVTGNSESLTIHTGYNGKYKDDDHGWKLSTAYDKARSDGEISRNQFFADLLKDWFWNTSPWFAFLQGRYDWDELKDWDYRLSASTGLGYEFVHDDNAYVVGRVGLGGNETHGEMEEVFTKEASFGLDASWSISERQSVDFKTTFYPSLEEDGEYRNITTFSWKMVMSEEARLGMKIGLSNEYDSMAAPDTEKSDFKYNLSLVWGL